MTTLDVTPAVPRRTSWRSKGLLIGILLLVNSAAIWGQAGWALDHIVPEAWPGLAGLALALGFAAALELIGVFLATMADEAEAQHQPAGGIRLGSYAVGLVSGGLNLSHWGVWTAAAFAFGFLSAISPFLWGIYSRVRRGRPIAPSRRFWHPIRSVQLIRHMAWRGLTDELVAIDAMAEVVQDVAQPQAAETASAPGVPGRVAARRREARVRHRALRRAVCVAHPKQVITAAQEARPDPRLAQERELVVRAIKETNPALPQRQIARLAMVPPTTVRQLLRRTKAEGAAQDKPINGAEADLEGAR